MARMVLMKIITIALAVYIICLSDFFPPSEGKNHRYRDIVNVLIVVCIDPALSNKVTNLSSLLGFVNITSINNYSQNGTQGRMTEIEVSLNHPSNARNQGKFATQNVTPHFIATGWFICKTDTKEKQTLHQGSPPQVSKMMISITDGSVLTGINELKILTFPLLNKINATWSYSSVNGRKTTKCYMEVKFQNSTIEDLTDQNRDLCTNKENCDIFVKKEAPNNPGYRDTTNYLTVTIKDMNRTNAETLREGIHVTWSIHSPDGTQITKYSTCIQVQNPSTEYQEQNCVLEIIWLALFPTICVILLIIISYQLFKEDSSCNAWKCRSNSDHLQEITEEYAYRNVPMPGEHSNQQEAPVYLNKIQHEGSRRQPSGCVACARESQLTVPIITYQGICDPVQPYGNMQQPNSEDTPGHEYENFLDLAACAPVLHRDHSHSTNTKGKRKIICL
ncbi:uncharacterized protein LOC144683384 isoform X5 [Cetorhinus maximus]